MQKIQPVHSKLEAETKRLRNLGSFEQATVQAAAAAARKRLVIRLAVSKSIQVEATSAGMAAGIRMQRLEPC
jgi:hypothetical protein